MPTAKTDSTERTQQRQRALQRWDNEGGASPERLPDDGSPKGPQASPPPLGNAELVQMQIRVIALENLVIALLAQASEAQLELVRDMATYISPRQGFTPHPLTLGAAGQMLSLVDRSGCFRLEPNGNSEAT